MSKRRHSKQPGRRNSSSSREANPSSPRSIPHVVEAGRPKKLNLALLCILLAALTIIVYGGLRTHPFINYDDGTYILSNPHIQQGLNWSTFVWAFTQFYAANWHPLTWLTHALDYRIFGSEAGGHHITSLLLHLLNVVLLFLLLERVTGARERSAFVAALFAVHPLNVESVAWAAELKNVLCTLFFLLALGAYGWYARKPSVKRYIPLVLVFFFGLASKPMVVTLPFVLLLLDFWPLQRILEWSEPSATFPVQQKPFWTLVLEKVPLLPLCVLSAYLTVAGQRSAGANAMVALSFAARLGNALSSYFVYTWKAFWPSGLAPFYPIPSAPVAFWRPISAAVFLLLVSALVWRGRRAHPYLLTGWLWFLGTLVPVLGLVQVGAQARADRYTYIPLIGLLVVFVWGLAGLAEARRLSPAPRVVLGSTVLALLSILSLRQLSFWNSSSDLWTHTLTVTSNNPVAEHNLAMELMRSRRWEEATPHLEKAKEINPTDAVSLVDLGAALAAQGRDKEAVQQYETAVQRSSDPRILVAAHQNLGYEYRKLGAEDKAETNYRQALSIDPRQMIAMEGLGQVLMNRQINEMSQSLETRPTAEGFLRYGRMLQQANRGEEARTAFENALKLDPNLREARSALDALPAQLDTK